MTIMYRTYARSFVVLSACRKQSNSSQKDVGYYVYLQHLYKNKTTELIFEECLLWIYSSSDSLLITTQFDLVL